MGERYVRMVPGGTLRIECLTQCGHPEPVLSTGVTDVEAAIRVAGLWIVAHDGCKTVTHVNAPPDVKAQVLEGLRPMLQKLPENGT